MLRHRGMRPGRRLGISLAPDARPWSGYRPAQPGRRCDDVIETGGLLGPLSSVTSNASRMGSASLSSFLNACFRLAVKRLSSRARGPATARQIVAETRWSRFSNAVTGQSTSARCPRVLQQRTASRRPSKQTVAGRKSSGVSRVGSSTRSAVASNEQSVHGRKSGGHNACVCVRVRGAAVFEEMPAPPRRRGGNVRGALSPEALAAHYRLLAESTNDVVGTGDNAGRITWISESVTSVLGWCPTTWWVALLRVCPP